MSELGKGAQVALEADLEALQARVAALEAAPAVAGVPGPEGPPGPKGDPGPAGKDGAQAPASIDDFLAALKLLLLNGASGGTVATPPDSTTPAAPTGPQQADANTYPILATGTYPEKLGAGPDMFEFRLRPSASGQPSQFDIVLNLHTDSEKQIAKGFSVPGGYDDIRDYQISGVFGQHPTFTLVGSGVGIADIYFESATFNGIPYYFNGVMDSRNSTPIENAMGDNMCYNSLHAQILTLSPWHAPAIPAIPAAALTQINGTDLKTLLKNATTDTTLPAGTFVGTGMLNPGLALIGAGQALTIIETSGVEPTQDKAAIVVQKGSKVSDLTAQHAYVDPGLGFNAAGIRNETPDPIDVARVTLKANQNGILTDGGTTGVSTITDVSLDGNGAVRADGSRPGNTHQMYLGGLPSATYNVTRAKTITPCRDAHEIKVRAGTSTHIDNDLVTGGFGSCYDFPNGGVHTIVGGSVALGAGEDRVLSRFGMENADNAAIGATLHFKDVVFKTAGMIIADAALHPDAKLILENCTYLTEKPDFSSGWNPANVTGDITQAVTGLPA